MPGLRLLIETLSLLFKKLDGLVALVLGNVNT